MPTTDPNQNRLWKALAWIVCTSIAGLVAFCVWVTGQLNDGQNFDRDILAASARNREVIDELRGEVRRLAERRDPSLELILTSMGEMKSLMRDAIERLDRNHSIHDERLRALERAMPR